MFLNIGPLDEPVNDGEAFLSWLCPNSGAGKLEMAGR